MNCEICGNQFNLTNKQPLMLPCCHETFCKECSLKIISAPQHDYKCPIKSCGQVNQGKGGFTVNKAIEKILKSCLGIFCDKHLRSYADFYCKDEKVYICCACALQDHKLHDTQKIEKQEIIQQFKPYCDSLKKSYKLIGDLISNWESFESNNMEYSATQFKNLVNQMRAIRRQLKPKQEEEEIKEALKEEVKNDQQQYQIEILKQEIENFMIQQQNQIIQNEIESSLVSTNDIEFLQKYITKDKQVSFQLLYRGTRDGFEAANFHTKCDNKSPTIMFIESEYDCIFGGYTTVAWQSPKRLVNTEDQNAFIFSISDRCVYKRQKQFVGHHYLTCPQIMGLNIKHNSHLKRLNEFSFEKKFDALRYRQEYKPIYDQRKQENLEQIEKSQNLIEQQQSLFEFSGLYSSESNQRVSEDDYDEDLERMVEYFEQKSNPHFIIEGEKKTWLAGGYNFKVTEIEIFQVIIQ